MNSYDYSIASGKKSISGTGLKLSPRRSAPRWFGSFGWLLLCFLFLATPTILGAQAPNWAAPNPADFSRTMNVVGVVNFEGDYSRSNLDQVAFFVNNEIRGVGDLTYIPGFGAEAFFTATIYSNFASGETVEIRVYYAADDQVYIANNPLSFVHTSVIGSFVNPYEFMIGSPIDEGIEFLPIDMQMTLEDIPFATVNLATSLVTIDNDPVGFFIDSLTPGVVWTLNDSLLTGVPNAGFVGDATVRVRAVEQTPNALSAERIVTYRVQPEVMGPNWHPVPPQNAVIGDTFPDLELQMMVDTLADSCYLFSYRPEFGQSPNAPAPNWMINTTFQSTMTLTTATQFTPAYVFEHPNDRLAAFIDGELRGSAEPVNVGGQSLFFLSIGSDAGTADTVRLQFYSGELERYFNYPNVLIYTPFGTVGTGANPDTLDLSNLIPVLHADRRLEMLIQEPDSSAFISFEFKVADCSFPDQIQDRITVPFCYGEPGEMIPLINLSINPAEVCEVRMLDLASIVESIETNGFTYTWDTNGNGDFLDDNGNGDNRYEFARYYRPGSIDIAQRRVTLSLRMASGMIVGCNVALGNNEIEVIVLRVSSGSFPWNGN